MIADDLVLPMIGLLVTVPSMVISLILRRVTPIGRWLRVAVSCLVVGLVYSALLMWDDAAAGFCCRQYHATAWTEMAFYVPLALLFALLGAVVLAPFEWLVGRLVARVRQ